MRGPSVTLWLLLALRSVLGGMQVRWCTTSDPEQQKCSDMSQAFQRAGLQPPLLCVQGASADHCVQLIADEEADAITLDGGAIYEAGKEHGLKPVVGEVYDQEVGTSYYAVAVVRRGSNLTIGTLKGVKSCHTGLNRTVGWNVPVGYLVESGRLSVMGCDVLRAVSEYFGGSCVPGAKETSYSESLCRQCRGNLAGEGVCEKSPLERYYDYSGAFRCLAEGAGDVAFVKHSTVLENTDGKTLPSWNQELQSQDFELLCRDGSRAEVTEWRRCHLARVPAHAVVVRAQTDGGIIFQLLNEGQRLFSHEGSSFQMFESDAYGEKNLLFKDATSELVPIATQTYEAWLGREYLHAMKGLICDPYRLPRDLRWCVLSTPEIQKCGDMAVAFSRQRLKPEIQCVSAESPQHCMQQIQAGQIDAVTLRGEDIYAAGKTYGLVPAAGELYAPEDRGSAYFAVAVVRRNSSDAFSLDELRGRRSCHSGLGSLAGWDVPVGTLTYKGLLRPRDCDVLTAVSEFFDASCVPVNNPTASFPSSLCSLCVGDEQGRNKCAGNSQERYYGDSGAFRCLAEKAGDVAFVKHTTVFDNTDGHNSESWAAKLRSEDYELLCPNGARAEVLQFSACNLAQIPAHAVMVRPDTNIFTVYGLLDKAQDMFGDDHNQNGFRMFDSSDYHGRDLLFKDSTVRVVPVVEKTTYGDWLGHDYMAALEGMLSQQCSNAGRAWLGSNSCPTEEEEVLGSSWGHSVLAAPKPLVDLAVSPSLPQDSTCPCCSHWCSQPIFSSPACETSLEGSPPSEVGARAVIHHRGFHKGCSEGSPRRRGTLPEAPEPGHPDSSPSVPVIAANWSQDECSCPSHCLGVSSLPCWKPASASQAPPVPLLPEAGASSCPITPHPQAGIATSLRSTVPASAVPPATLLGSALGLACGPETGMPQPSKSHKTRVGTKSLSPGTITSQCLDRLLCDYLSEEPGEKQKFPEVPVLALIVLPESKEGRELKNRSHPQSDRQQPGSRVGLSYLQPSLRGT
ncbi:melanotransferrin [Suncus etruscus]|uniref:melanotransferrin n=1 Tax=Suncus etruscus TaxID=109475 RepID=UPI00210FD364|nr:melanotransferrin [Suncus etruscus]